MFRPSSAVSSCSVARPCNRDRLKCLRLSASEWLWRLDISLVVLHRTMLEMMLYVTILKNGYDWRLMKINILINVLK